MWSTACFQKVFSFDARFRIACKKEMSEDLWMTPSPGVQKLPCNSRTPRSGGKWELPDSKSVYQLQQLCGCNVPAPAALSPGEKPSEHLSTRRVGELRFIMLWAQRRWLSRVRDLKRGFTRLLRASSSGSVLGGPE